MKARKTNPIFDQFKDGLLSIDPVHFCERWLTLDGKPFRLSGNGYRPFADIYRYIGVTALQPNSKPVVFVKGRQVGATTMAGALELFFMASGLFGTGGKPPMRVMHAFPLLDIAYTYTKTKLNAMISTAVPDPNPKPGKPMSYVESRLDRAASANDSLQFKQFINGNHIQIESTGIDANRLRGRTVDAILFDECQDIGGAALANAIQILSKAQYGPPTEGVQVYFGTPKQKGSTYWDLWKSSSQQYFFLGCENCGEHFPLYTPESDDWEEIWIEDNIPREYVDSKTGLRPHGFIVKCTHCGHKQDKRPAAERGRWVPMRDDISDCRYVGFHLNQLYMPDTPREKIIAKKPENSEIYTERAYRNEVLGEFFAGDSTPITPEEIEELCGDKHRAFRSGINKSEGKKSYLGLDWGQKVDTDQLVIGDRERKSQGQSYSVAVVLTVESPTILSIDYAKLLKRNDFEYKKSFVDETFRRYSIERAVGDIGYAGDLTEILHRDFGERFLASRAVSRVKHHAKFNSDVFPQEIQFERNYYIAELFDKLKRGEIRFPYKYYEQIGWLVQHCSSMEIKPSIDRTGNIDIKYVKGATPNDGFMALLNAYLAFKHDTTGGFQIVHPDQAKDVTSPQKIPAILGYIPGMNPSKR